MNANLSPMTKQVLSMKREEFEEYVRRWDTEFKEEQGGEIGAELADVASSAGQPNFDKVLFDEKSKGFVKIQYGRKGSDYIYHIFFKKEPKVEIFHVAHRIWESVAKLLPREPEKVVSPPQRITDFAEPYYVDCYTLLVKDITKFSGSRRMMEEVFVNDLLNGLNSFFTSSGDK